MSTASFLFLFDTSNGTSCSCALVGLLVLVVFVVVIGVFKHEGLLSLACLQFFWLHPQGREFKCMCMCTCVGVGRREGDNYLSRSMLILAQDNSTRVKKIEERGSKREATTEEHEEVKVVDSSIAV